MTEAEFVAQAGRKPTEAERVSHGIPWLPVIAPEVPAPDLPNVAPASISGSVSQAEPMSPISEPSVSSQSEASSAATGEDPNAGASPAVASSPAVGDSASDVSAVAGASNSGANFADLPLHVKVAQHLEAIYRLVKGE
jgi:hypothetical protein